MDLIIELLKFSLNKIDENKKIELKNIEMDLYIKELNIKFDDVNKYIDVLYKSIHSVFILQDTTKEKVNIIKCEPVPSYIRFINNTIN